MIALGVTVLFTLPGQTGDPTASIPTVDPLTETTVRKSPALGTPRVGNSHHPEIRDTIHPTLRPSHPQSKKPARLPPDRQAIAIRHPLNAIRL